jgi:hypothetical protein
MYCRMFQQFQQFLTGRMFQWFQKYPKTPLFLMFR